MVDGWTLRARRRETGLSAKQVARAAGTSETNIAAYERGDKRPSTVTGERITTALHAGASSAVFAHNLLTLPSAAAVIRKGLRQGWPTSDLLRVVRELRSNAKWMDSDNDFAVLFSEPSTTGDPRWDVLLAGVAEDLARAADRPFPQWANRRTLNTFWFVGTNEAFHAYAVANSPASLKVRGVMIDPAELKPV